MKNGDFRHDLHVRVSDSELYKLKELAESNGFKNVSSLIRSILRSYIISFERSSNNEHK